MQQKSLMIQGTASTVGKSLITAALCRIFTQDGYSTAPFKSQNMSLNSYITAEGGEMGRAQVVQAYACKKLPHVCMNPVLLKPTDDRCSQIIVNGSVRATMKAKDYFSYKKELLPEIKQAFDSILNENDIVVIEGAGSPAEINLKENDIVNMGMAKIAKSPVILVGDIDKGGVFASLVGTMLLLEKEERQYVKGFLINKFRGDVSLLQPGLERLTQLTGIPVLGVIPMLDIEIEQEDSAGQWNHLPKNGNLSIAIIDLPFLSNDTDIHALSLEKDISIEFVKSPTQLLNANLIILPGTKSTMAARQFLRETKLDKTIQEKAKQGCFIFGICGGYQLLGVDIIDNYGVESEKTKEIGLKLLNVKTTFAKKKHTIQSSGQELLFSTNVTGYEIHMGEEQTNCYDFLPKVQPMIQQGGIFEGAIAQNGQICGTYFHGIFDNGPFTRKYLNQIRKNLGLPLVNAPLVSYYDFREKQLERLAGEVRKAIDIEKLYKIIRNGIK